MALVIDSRVVRRLLAVGAVLALVILLLPDTAAQPANGKGKLSPELEHRDSVRETP